MKLGTANVEIIKNDYSGVLALGARIDPELPLAWSVAIAELLHCLGQVQRGQWLPGVPPTPVFVRWIGNVHGDLTVKLRMPGGGICRKAEVGRLLEYARRNAMEAEREEVATWKV